MTLNELAVLFADKLKSEKLGHFYILEGHYDQNNFDQFIETFFLKINQKIKKDYYSQDFFILQKDPKENEIKVQSKEFQTFIKFVDLKPIALSRKIVFIFDAEELGPILYNKILKTLEENEHTTFFLFKNQFSHLMPTILSRAILLRHDSNNLLQKQDSKSFSIGKIEFQTKDIFNLEKPNYASCENLLEALKDDITYEAYHSSLTSRMAKLLP